MAQRMSEDPFGLQLQNALFSSESRTSSSDAVQVGPKALSRCSKRRAKLVLPKDDELRLLFNLHVERQEWAKSNSRSVSQCGLNVKVEQADCHDKGTTCGKHECSALLQQAWRNESRRIRAERASKLCIRDEIN
eukprot:6203149-Pleurochrysis_carterae.AAC.2